MQSFWIGSVPSLSLCLSLFLFPSTCFPHTPAPFKGSCSLLQRYRRSTNPRPFYPVCSWNKTRVYSLCRTSWAFFVFLLLLLLPLNATLVFSSWPLDRYVESIVDWCPPFRPSVVGTNVRRCWDSSRTDLAAEPLSREAVSSGDGPKSCFWMCVLYVRAF